MTVRERMIVSPRPPYVRTRRVRIAGNGRRYVCLEQTNRPVQGLVSIDRSKVAALISTTPRPRPKSSTNDLALDLDTVDSRFTTAPDGRYVRTAREDSRLVRGFKTTPVAERRSNRLYRCLPTVGGHQDIVACLGGILT